MTKTTLAHSWDILVRTRFEACVDFVPLCIVVKWIAERGGFGLVVKQTERIINLALLLSVRSSDTRGVSAATIREEIYFNATSDNAFQKQFLRDKQALRAAGLVIESHKVGKKHFSRLVPDDTFARIPDLCPEERATLAVVGFSQLQEPLFPLPFALRMAMTKLSGIIDEDIAPELRKLPAGSALGRQSVDSDTDAESDALFFVESLIHACKAGTVMSMAYANKQDQISQRIVEPHGLFLLSGRWYLVAFDRKSGEVRTFKLGRIASLTVTDETFVPPEGGTIEDRIKLPFETGLEEYVQTTVIIPAGISAHLGTLTEGRGKLSPLDDGSYEWHISYSDLDLFVGYAAENGLTLTGERERKRLAEGLQAAVSIHAG